MDLMKTDAPILDFKVPAANRLDPSRSILGLVNV